MKSLIALLALCVAFTGDAEAQAPAKTDNLTPGYLLVLGRSTDRAKIIAYSSQLPPIYAATGGRYIGQGRPGGGVTCVYGMCEGRSSVIAQWADAKSIEAFWWGDAYRKVVPMRDGAGVFTVVGIKGAADVQPFTAGALLIATVNANAAGSNLTATQTWLAAASADSGARLLAPFTSAAVIPLEGDALYNRVALLSFESKEKRDTFAVSESTQALIKHALPQSLISIIAVDAPPTAPPVAVVK